MKCPYAVNRNSQSLWKYKYRDDGQQDKVFNTEINNAVFVDCLEENCGAWQNNKCCYGKSE